VESKKALCHDCLAPLFHPIGENVCFAKPSYTIEIVEVTGTLNSFDAKLRAAIFEERFIIVFSFCCLVFV
jgi:hypothetical protein